MSANPAGFDNFRPLNPWGRAMPKPSRPVATVHEGLYQLYVTQNGRLVPVGPKAPKELLEGCLVAMNSQISLGREKTWSDPHLVKVQG